AAATSIPRWSRTEPMPDLAAAKILVADDDQSLVRTLMWILKENGYEVVVAPGGEGLMGKLEAERPHLLLLDIMMPKVDGLQLLAKMKADERFRDLPVLMISSMPPEEATVKSLGLGAADFIAKPFRVRELLARVKAHIRTAQELAVARDEAQSRAALFDEGPAGRRVLPPHHGTGSAAHPRRRPVRRDRDPHGGGGDRESLRLRDRGVRQEAAREARRDRRPDRLPQPSRTLGRARAGAGPRGALQPRAHDPARGHRPLQA